MTGITIKPALEAELAACLALIPLARGLPVEFLLARNEGRLAGAAAVLWRSWSTPGGFPLMIEVLPDERRRGVGRALVAGAAALVAREAPGLWSAQALDLAGDQAAFLAACGFLPRKRQHHFQVRADEIQARIGRLMARLRARGLVPDDARVVPLAEAPLPEVGWLVSADFGGGPFSAHRRLRQREAMAGDRSLVLLVGEEPAAVLLLHREGEIGFVDIRLVAPGWRRSWPLPLVMEEMLRRGEADGLKHWRFLSDETNRDTMSLAHRQDAQTLAEQAYFYYAAAA